nr:MAG TPA: PROTEIN/DNA Complex-DNA complex, DNA BINDING PROTEIN-DNA.4A [Caudoviricetes sp.]
MGRKRKNNEWRFPPGTHKKTGPHFGSLLFCIGHSPS